MAAFRGKRMPSGRPKGMIFLDEGNQVLQTLLKKRLAPGAAQEPADVTIADFDSVAYRVFVAAEAKNWVYVSIAMPCLGELRKYGADMLLEEDYDGMVCDTSEGYDLTIAFDLDNLSDTPEAIIKKVSCLKRNLMGAPLNQSFAAMANGASGSLSPIQIDYRASESLFIVPGADRVVVVYSVDFADETDKAIAMVFLQEFAEAQRRERSAPPCAFSRDPPREVEDMELKDGVLGYVSFAVMGRHVDSEAKRENVVTLLQGFRAYLHYHIKASKSYLHTRMRARVSALLKVLRRAHPGSQAEGDGKKKKAKRTWGGKTMKNR